jgi:branched-chain amino acid transport system substrate-binding protein
MAPRNLEREKIMAAIRLKRRALMAGTGALIAGYSGSVRAQSKTVALGVSAPITGDMTQYGIDIRQGVELAVSEINKAPPRCPACR